MLDTLNLRFGGGEALPNWLKLIPKGRFRGAHGREFINDHPEPFLATFAASQVVLPVDIEHSTQLKGPKGELSPAVGWIEELFSIDGTVWGRVVWNHPDRNAALANTYQSYAPVFEVAKGTDRIVSVMSIGLTNRHSSVSNSHLPAPGKRGAESSKEVSNRRKHAISTALHSKAPKARGYAAPPGYKLDSARVALHNRIAEYATKHKLSYCDAALMVDR